MVRDQNQTLIQRAKILFNIYLIKISSFIVLVASFIFEEIQNVPSSQKWWMVTQMNQHTPEQVVIKPNITQNIKFESFEV